MRDAALRYAALGWLVFPIWEPTSPGECSCHQGTTCDRAGKHPRTRSGHLAASSDPKTIRGWWSRWPSANIGVATGRGLLVVDVDGPDGERTLASLPQLPPTVEQSTGRGRHVLYRVPGPASTTTGRLGSSIDTRGDGGYIVLAPSLHASGRRYQWTRAPGDVALADAPTWLIDALAGTPPHCVLPAGCLPSARREGHKGGGHDTSDSGEDAREALRMIRRGATDAEIANVLRDRGSYRKRASSERVAEDYLRRTIAWARSQPLLDPWAGALRVRVQRAQYERLMAKPWAGKEAADRVSLWCSTTDGKVLPRQAVYLHASAYAAVLPDIPPRAWVDAADYGRALAESLKGRELEIVMNGGPRAARMRKAP